jgi:type I restriction enzyme S subunit
VAGRNVAFVQTIPGRFALSVNDAGLPAPKGWAWVRLGDIARLESGHTPSRNHPEYWDGDIAWVGIKDAREHHGGVINDTSQHVTQAGLDNSAARLLPADTVCLSRTASVGYVVIMGRPMATSQDFVNWVCSPAIEPAYLKWILLAEGQEGLRKFGKGTTHTTIYFPEVQAFHACVAPLNEQRRIVAKLDEVFAQTRAAKARLERLPALIDKLKRSILAAAFRGDLTADWRAANPDVEPASELLERCHAERQRQSQERLRAKGTIATSASYEPAPPADASNLPDIPASWKWASLATLANIQGGVTKGQKRSDNEQVWRVPYLRVANVQRGRLDLTEVLEIEATRRDIDELSLLSGDILLNEGGDRDKLGRGWIWEGQLPVCIHQNHVFRARLYDRAMEPRLVSTWANAFGQPWFVDEGKQTTNLASISKSKLSRFPVPVPPAAEQSALVALTTRMLGMLDALASRIVSAQRRIKRVEQAALAKAFRGELVPQDPADEPAEVLLARLRAAKAEEAPVARRSRAAAPAPTYAAPPITLAQAAESGPLFQHALERRERAAPEPAAQDLVVAALQQSDGRLTAAAIAQTTGLAPAAVRAALKDLIAAGQVHTHGKARGTTYAWLK